MMACRRRSQLVRSSRSTWRRWRWSGTSRIGEKVGAVEDAVTGLHVEQFDGEDVGGAVELIAGEDERWVVALFDPPFGDGVERFEIVGVGVVNKAEDVEVGLAGAEFSGGGGAVENDGDEVRACGGVEAVEEFFELGFHFCWALD